MTTIVRTLPNGLFKYLEKQDNFDFGLMLCLYLFYFPLVFPTNLYEFRYSLYYCVLLSCCLRFLFQVMKILDFFFAQLTADCQGLYN